MAMNTTNPAVHDMHIHTTSSAKKEKRSAADPQELRAFE